MKTIVLLNGTEEARESFHNVTEESFKKIKFYISNYIEDTRKLNEDFYEGFSQHLEKDCVEGGKCSLETIEGYDRILSRMLQDDFPVWEVEVNKTGILSKGNCCFCLNYEAVDFKECAIELINKLSI